MSWKYASLMLLYQLQYNNFNHPMQQLKWTLPVLLTLIWVTVASTKIENPAIPQNFGLATITYTRDGDNSVFERFMEHYATMDCPIISEINIVWNNEQTPEEMGILKNKAKWKRPINFYLTPYNSLSWRYKIPQESKARVYFSLDDEIIIVCDELVKGFKVWQSKAVGEIGPVVSFQPRVFFYSDEKQFQYKFKAKSYYNIGLLGFAYISRHFFQLYYADLWVMEQMRKVVAEKNNCEDIGLNFMAQYFYPELLTTIYPGKKKGQRPDIMVSNAPDHLKKRNECVQQYTDIFGVNSLRYKPLKEKFPATEERIFPLRNETVLARRAYLDRKVLHKVSQDDVDYLGQVLSSKTIKDEHEQLIQSKLQIISKLKEELADSILNEVRLAVKIDQLKKSALETDTPQNQSPTSLQQTLIEPATDSVEVVQQQWVQGRFIYGGVGLLCVAILICLWKCAANRYRQQTICNKMKAISMNMSQQQGFDQAYSNPERNIEKDQQ